MTMQLFKLPEILKSATDTRYYWGALTDQAGQKPIPGHGATVNPQTWLQNTVLPWTKSKRAEPGIYYIYLYADRQKKTKPDIFPINIGNVPMSENQPAQPPVYLQAPVSKAEQVLTYDSALKLQKEISDLAHTVTALQKENAELKKANEEIEDEEEEEEETETLSENTAPGWLPQLISGILPVIDKHFEMQNNKMKLFALTQAKNNPEILQQLQFLNIAPSNGNGMQMKQPATQQLTPEQITAQKADEFLTLLKTQNEPLHAEMEKIMHVVKENKGTLNDFFNEVYEKHPEVYSAMYNHVNA